MSSSSQERTSPQLENAFQTGKCQKTAYACIQPGCNNEGAHGRTDMSYAGCKTPVPKRPNAVMEMSVATVQKEIGELQHKVDEKEASRNLGNGPQEREETIRIKNVAALRLACARCV